jgi:outer membrane protein TolC
MVAVLQGGKRLLITVSALALLAGCAVTPTPFTKDELAKQAADDRTALFAHSEPLTHPLSMSEAMARALKYNLDKRAKMMEEALALGQTDINKFDLLPKVTAQAGYAGRNVPEVSRSIDSVTLQPSASNPTVSQDRDRQIGSLGMSWNILDFGVSYYTAHQNADRALIATERRRKTVHNLAQEVRYAYWRAAAYQVLKPTVDEAVADARQALTTSRTVERENLKAPVDALRYQKALLETLRQLTSIQQDLSSAQFELASLVNLPPGQEIVLDVPTNLQVPTWTMPLDQMEESAFINNPDLHEQAYLSRVAVDDTRKAILRLLPGINLSASRQFDSNSYLVDKRWYETGATLSFNLLNLASAPAQIDYAETNEDVVTSRRLALRMAVLAQVHIAERQFRNAESQYLQADELWLVDKRLSELSSAKTANDAQGTLERVSTRLGAIASQLRRFQNYGLLEQSYAKMQATLGEDLFPEPAAAAKTGDPAALVGERGERSADWGHTAPSEPASVVQPASVAAPVPPVPQAGLATTEQTIVVVESQRDLRGNLSQVGTAPQGAERR